MESKVLLEEQEDDVLSGLFEIDLMVMSMSDDEFPF